MFPMVPQQMATENRHDYVTGISTVYEGISNPLIEIQIVSNTFADFDDVVVLIYLDEIP